MDPIINKPATGPDPANNQFDPSYQVMPQEGNLRAMPAPTPTPPMPPAPKSPLSPVAPTIPRMTPPPMMDLPVETDDSANRGRKIVYAIIGIVVLVLLAGGAYVLLGRKTAPVRPAVATQLPKVWLQQYFATNLDSNGNCIDQSICGDNADPDNDGLTNLEEFKNGTSPINPDTDGDGLADGDEVHVYKTDPALKYTDTRPIVATNNWTDGFQIKNGYDPLTPGQKFTDARKQQITTDTATYKLHAPTMTTLGLDQNGQPVTPASMSVPANSTSSSTTPPTPSSTIPAGQ